MKQSFLFIAFLVSVVASGYAKYANSEMPDLKNPKIIKLQKILNADDVDIDALRQEYEAILNGKSIEDKLHLFTFDQSNPKATFVDWSSFTDQGNAILDALSDLPESDYKDFASGITFFRMARNSVKDDKTKKENLDAAFHFFLKISDKGEARVTTRLAWCASELYRLGVEDEHLTEDLIIKAYQAHYALNQKNEELIHYLRKGLYYENIYKIKFSAEEIKQQARYKKISTLILTQLLIDFPNRSEDLIYGLWLDHLVQSSFGTKEIKYYPNTAMAVSEFVNSTSAVKGINYNQIKSVDILFQYFLDNEHQFDLPVFLKLNNNNKNEAFKKLMAFFDKVSSHPYIPIDILNVRPQWVRDFEKQVNDNIEKAFPYTMKYSQEAGLVKVDGKVSAGMVKSSVSNFDKIKAMKENENISEGDALYGMYKLKSNMEDIMYYESLSNISDLKWECARMVLDFELAYLDAKDIHSPTILKVSEVFENFTKADINRYREEVTEWLSEYLDIYNIVADDSLEALVVMNELKKVANLFGLLNE